VGTAVGVVAVALKLALALQPSKKRLSVIGRARFSRALTITPYGLGRRASDPQENGEQSKLPPLPDVRHRASLKSAFALRNLFATGLPSAIANPDCPANLTFR
jgi:hypothetical protein